MAILDLVDILSSIPSGGAVNIQPASNENWFLLNLASDSADVRSFIRDASTVFTTDPFADVKPYGDKISINNSYYLRVENVGASTEDLSYSFHKEASVTSITRGFSIASGGIVTIQPASGEYWMIDKIVSSSSSNIAYSYYDGSNIADITDLALHNRQRTLLISNSRYLRIINNTDGTQYVAISGKKMPTGVTLEVNGGTLAGGGSITVQPAANEQWVLLSCGGSQSIIFEKFDGTNARQVSVGAFSRSSLPLTNTNYLRIRNSGGATLPYAYAVIKEM